MACKLKENPLNIEAKECNRLVSFLQQNIATGRVTEHGRILLDVQIVHAQRIGFNKRAARFDQISHQCRENFIG